MQDRIIGPLTMLQFVYAVVGFGMCYIIFSAVPAPFSYILILPIVFIVVCLDFVKVNERPFLDFITALLVFFTTPRERFWHQGDDSDLTIEVYRTTKATGSEIKHKDISLAQIQDFAKQSNKGGGVLISK